MVSLAVQLSVVLLAAWAFSQFETFFAVGLCAVAVLLLLIPTSFYFFRYGMWIEYSLPLLAMVVHRGISRYRDIRQQLRERESVRRSVP